jgi:hypothetical protein
VRDEEVWAVWNRAALGKEGEILREGDRALASLLIAHSMIMGDGIQTAVEVLSDAEVDAASAGYRYFGLAALAELIQRAKPYRDRHDEELEGVFEEWEKQYSQRIPRDDALVDIFERRLRQHPDQFAPP